MWKFHSCNTACILESLKTFLNYSNHNIIIFRCVKLIHYAFQFKKIEDYPIANNEIPQNIDTNIYRSFPRFPIISLQLSTSFLNSYVENVFI